MPRIVMAVLSRDARHFSAAARIDKCDEAKADDNFIVMPDINDFDNLFGLGTPSYIHIS